MNIIHRTSFALAALMKLFASGYVAQSDYTFAVIAGSQKAVITWGDSIRGGDSMVVSSQISSGIVQVVGNEVGIAALTLAGAVHAWGAYVDAQYVPSSILADLQSNVKMLIANDGMDIIR